MGCYNDYIVEHLKGVNGILLEANHDVNMLQVGTYPYPLKQRIFGTAGPSVPMTTRDGSCARSSTMI